LDIHPWRWRDNYRWVVIWRPAWSPVSSEGHDDAGADEDSPPSRPMPSAVPMASEPVTSELMASEPVASNPMPATLRVPWDDADEEQHHQYDDDPHPRLPCSHGHHLSLRAQTRMFPGSVPTISPALPGQSHVGLYEVRGGLICVADAPHTSPSSTDDDPCQFLGGVYLIPLYPFSL
jgi:hypothetical protein